MWRTPTNGNVWRASLESPGFNKRQGFNSLEEMFDFLKTLATEPDEDKKEIEMTALFTANLIMNLFFGLGFTLLPAQMLSVYQANMSAEFVFMTRMFGIALLSTCVILWYARRSDSQLIIDFTAKSNLLYWVLGSLALLFAQLAGLFNFMGWGTFGFHVFFALWYLYMMFIRK